MKARLRNLLYLGAGLLGLVAALIAGLPFVSTCAFEWWVALAERFNPGVDAPDNWALGLTYCMWMAFGVAVMAAICGFIALRGARFHRDGRVEG